VIKEGKLILAFSVFEALIKQGLLICKPEKSLFGYALSGIAACSLVMPELSWERTENRELYESEYP